jgi:hypothetical protein
MKFKTKEPAPGSLAASGPSGKGFVLPHPAVVTHRQSGGIDLVDARFLPQLRNQERRQG